MEGCNKKSQLKGGTRIQETYLDRTIGDYMLVGHFVGVICVILGVFLFKISLHLKSALVEVSGLVLNSKSTISAQTFMLNVGLEGRSHLRLLSHHICSLKLGGFHQVEVHPPLRLSQHRFLFRLSYALELPHFLSAC